MPFNFKIHSLQARPGQTSDCKWVLSWGVLWRRAPKRFIKISVDSWGCVSPGGGVKEDSCFFLFGCTRRHRESNYRLSEKISGFLHVRSEEIDIHPTFPAAVDALGTYNLNIEPHSPLGPLDKFIPRAHRLLLLIYSQNIERYRSKALHYLQRPQYHKVTDSFFQLAQQNRSLRFNDQRRREREPGMNWYLKVIIIFI